MLEDQVARSKAKQVLQLFRTHSFGLERPYIGPCCQGGHDTSAKAATQGRCITGPTFRMESADNVVHIERGATPRRPSLPTPLVSPAKIDPALILDTLPPIVKAATPEGIGHVVVEHSGSSTSLSLDRRSTGTGGRMSFSDLSTRSQQLVNWSSGSVLSPRPTPVYPLLTCNCVPRTNISEVPERLVLRISNVAFSVEAKQPTIETNEHCGLHQDMLHVYESYSRPNIQKHRIWLKTRRLVVSHKPDSSSRQLCSSFWLPLTEISFVLKNNGLTLRWSDCNQWNVRPIGNNKQSCDCIYDSDNPNNEIILSFADAEVAVMFLDNLCAVYNDADGVKEWRNVEIAGQQTLRTVDVQDQDTIAYRLACLTTHSLSSTSKFQVFIHWPSLDLDIRIVPEHEGAQCAMAIHFDQISTPHYTSDVANEPWVDKSKTARYKASELVFGAYSMRFPFGSISLSSLPEGKHLSQTMSRNTRADQIGVEQTLKYLTGWTICFFAPDVKLTKVHKISNTGYGISDVILWKRCLEVHTSFEQETRITFRHRKSELNYLWRSGVGNSSITYHHSKHSTDTSHQLMLPGKQPLAPSTPRSSFCTNPMAPSYTRQP
jgi:hypothetical protein